MKSHSSALKFSMEPMRGQEISVLLASGKTLRGVFDVVSDGLLVLYREVKFEPTPEEVHEALTQTPPIIPQVGVVKSKILVNVEEISAIEGVISSNLKSYEVTNSGNISGSTGEVDKAGAQAGPAPDRRLPSTPGDAIPS